MEPDRNQLKLLTPDELERLQVEACKRWAPTPEVEPVQVAEAKAELDLRQEGLAFHSTGALGASALWDQSTPNSHCSAKVYA
jgi:hypothetical protein